MFKEWVTNKCKHTQKKNQVKDFVLYHRANSRIWNMGEWNRWVRAYTKTYKMLNMRKQTSKVNLQKDCKPNKLFFSPLKLVKWNKPIAIWPQRKECHEKQKEKKCSKKKDMNAFIILITNRKFFCCYFFHVIRIPVIYGDLKETIRIN